MTPKIDSGPERVDFFLKGANLLYLLPDSPDFNPIEMAFSQLKY